MNEQLLKFFTEIGFSNFDPKNYVDPGTPLQKGEKLIGTMNDLEKSCFSFLNQKEQEHAHLHEKGHNGD